MIGAATAALIYEYAPLKPKKRDTKENMMDAIFMAKKKRGEKDDGDDEEEEEVGERADGDGVDVLPTTIDHDGNERRL